MALHALEVEEQERARLAAEAASKAHGLATGKGRRPRKK